MNDKLSIYFSKIFCRLRNKTQLFNGLEDDHYHTRLQHTIEVEEIALLMAKRINDRFKSSLCDLRSISKIALLHDIGHTPFGHTGERALHEMVSGKADTSYGLPNFVSMDVAIGFKHNINSGLLYIENLKYQEIERNVLDGIMKHSSLVYDGDSALDYGFEYITHDIDIRYDSNFLTIDGFIVAQADEIAQMCSDYLDISLGAKPNKNHPNLWEPYNKVCVDSRDYRKNARNAANYMIDLFIKSFEEAGNFQNFHDNEFADVLRSFGESRSVFIRSNRKIVNYDVKQGETIKKLFAYYYLYPEKLTNDFFDDFIFRAKRLKYKTKFYDFVSRLDSSDHKQIIEVVEKLKLILESKKGKNVDHVTKDYRSFFKMYIRSIAVQISKMTDNYAQYKFSHVRLQTHRNKR